MISDIVERIEHILEICEGDKKLIAEHLEELLEEPAIEYVNNLATLIKMILPDNIYYDEFREDLSNLIPSIGMGVYCRVHIAVEMFILKVLIEMKVKTGKEIDCSI